MLELLSERVSTIGNRVPALEQSIKEIKLDWVYHESREFTRSRTS